VKRISVIISYLCGLVVLSALPGTATSLTGSVVDPSGKIVEHATVQLTRAANASITTAISDRNGQYVFQNVGAGDYLLSASAGALSAPEPLTVKVSEDADQAITIHLEITATRNQVTVTAAALPQSFDLVSKALDVVNTDEAERRGVFTLADALQEVPGLRVVSRGGPGAFTTIQTRGLRTADTSILVDGFRFRDITGTQGDASSFIGDLFLVDSSRIEVLRGSGSSLYGTNSIAGTINVITDQGGGPVHGDLDFQSGGLGVNRGLAHVGGGSPDGRLFYSGGLAYLNELSGVNGGGPARNWSGQGGATYVLTPTLRIGGRLLADTHYLQLTTSPYPVFGSSSDPIVSAVAPSSTQLSLANAGQPFSVAGATFVPNLNDPDARINSRFLSGLIHLDNQLTPRFSWRVSMQSESTHRNNIN
jgi:outer membrane receptor protein involved in Fe transport